jgi:hypothetical protein
MGVLDSKDNFGADGLRYGAFQVKVKNTTGLVLPQYSVIGLAQPIILPSGNLDEFKRQITFNAVSPNENNPWGVLQEPLAPGRIGAATIAGATIVRLDYSGVEPSRTPLYAGPATGSTNALQVKKAGGSRVLWAENAGSVRWGVVHINYHTPTLHRVVLSERLYRCYMAMGELLWVDGCTPEGVQVMVVDRLGIAPAAGLPADTPCWVAWQQDTEYFELVSYGEGCCAPASSSHGSSQPSSWHSSAPSHSSYSYMYSSASSHPSSHPSSHHSSAASSATSSQPSQGSSAPPSGSGGSQKSTAIVPASWQPTGYTALFIHEMPEVRFDDVIVDVGPLVDKEVKIDPRFLEVCDAGTIEVCGVSCDYPVAIGAKVMGSVVSLWLSKHNPDAIVRIVIRLTGVRRGFSGVRFPARTHEQFLANERFINSAYPSDPRAT